ESVGRPARQSVLRGLLLVVDDEVRLVATARTGPKESVEEVHVDAATAGRARSQALVAAADSLEPFAAEGEVVAAPQGPGRGAAAELNPALARPRRDRHRAGRRVRQRQHSPSDEVESVAV